MVYTVYHSEKLGAISRLIKEAKPVDGGAQQEGRGETTGTNKQGPERVTTQIMFKVILTLSTSKNTGEQSRFTKSMAG